MIFEPRWFFGQPKDKWRSATYIYIYIYIYSYNFKNTSYEWLRSEGARAPLYLVGAEVFVKVLGKVFGKVFGMVFVKVFVI